VRLTKTRIAAGILLMLAATSSADAQDVRLRAVSGTGGVVKARRWTPIVIELDSSRSSFRGQLMLSFGDAVLQRQVFLPSPGRRQFELYLRTASPESTARVELRSADVRIAAADVPLRVVPADQGVTLCIVSADGTSPGGPCTATTSAELLPRSMRGYAAIDDVAWATGGARLTDEQRTALGRWQAFRRLETSGDLSLAPSPSRPLVRRGLPRQSARDITMLYGAYVGLLILIAVIATYRTPRLTFMSLMISLVVALGSAAAFSVGSVGPGNRIHAYHDSVLHQIPGMNASVISVRGILELPAKDEYAIQLRHRDGAIEQPSSGEGVTISIDADGFPALGGVYGLGSRLSFSAEAVVDVEPIEVTAIGESVTLANRSSATVENCRFADGFSKRKVGRIAPGDSVTAERVGAVWGPMFTCTTTNRLVNLSARNRTVEMDGATLIAVYDPAPRALTHTAND
jgi:hypothetical protein